MRSTLSRMALWMLAASVFFLSPSPTHAQDVILQGFYWNTNPGDISDVNNGLWWDTIALVAPYLADAGFKTVWTPPATKGSGIYDMGYGTYDYYDFGDINQQFTTRTRHGSRAEMLAMIQALHDEGLLAMADLVLNHRGSANAQQLEDCDDGDGLQMRWTDFNPGSGRLPMDAWDFHPNAVHCDLNSPYHDRLFFEDLCYFNFLDQTLDPPANDWYFGPHNLGKVGDSLIVWGRYLLDNVGFDEVRLDAVKHIEPGFLAPFLVELGTPNQPFAVGELFDGSLATLKGYHDEVEGFVSNYGIGSKDANLAIFDFNLRYALRDMCNNGGGGFNMWNLNTTGLRFNPAGGLDGEDIVTFVENHDVDRIGWQVVSCASPHQQQVGSTCLQLYTDGGHDPIVSDKEDMGYPYLMAAEGRPAVFWKDFFWYGLNDDITWQMALRDETASGDSDPIQDLAPVFTSGHGGDLFVLNRDGASGAVNDGGMVLTLNDNSSSEASVWVNTPFSDQYLKDYSDGYLFVTTKAFADSRANVKAQARDYAWWSVTGLYPKPAGTTGAHFQMDATPGGCPHFIALRVADAANLLVNGAPIAVGDEVAVKNGAGDIAGIGRIGQATQWDGMHDMLIEALGEGSVNGMGNGEQFTFVVYDQSASAEVTIGYVQYAAVGSTFSFSPDRPNSPNRNGNYSMFNVTTTRQGLYDCGGISQVLAFENPVLALVDRCGDASQANAGVYDNGLQAGDIDGSGFLGWTNIQTPGTPTFSGIFIGSSAGNGDGDDNADGDINTGNEAWGFYANTFNTVEATRPFAAALTVGQTFSMKMDNGWIDNGGTVGFGLRNSSGNNVWEFFFTGGNANYSINAGSGVVATTVGFTDEGLLLEFLLTSSTTYQLKLTQLSNGNVTTYTGTLMNPAGGSAIDRVRLFNYNAGSGGQRDAFFNAMQICDPPALVINEVDYDQAGADNAEFVELRNMNTTAVNLDDFFLQLVNGVGSAVYENFNLPNVNLAAGDYFVVCLGGYAGPDCDLTFSASIQNGAPDAVRLVWNTVTVDALSYEGDVPGAVEGSGVGLLDPDTSPGVGLSRVPDGTDTDQNNADFELTCITPGTANEPDNTDTDNDTSPDACDTCPLAQDEGNIANFDTPNCGCLPGYYAVTTTVNGQEVITGCQLCPPGYFCPDGVNSYPCQAGSFQDQPGQIACVACSAGSYSDVIAAVFCTLCPAGKYQSSAGATECLDCEAGKFNPVTGAVICQDCPPGKYQPNTGSILCNNCPTGTYASTTANVHCETCEPGSEAPVTGSVLCVNCTPPSFSSCPTVPAVNNTAGQCDAPVTVPSPVLSGLCTRNHALDFDGVDDYVDNGSLSFLNGVTAFTVEAWVMRTTNTINFPNIFSKNVPGAWTLNCINIGGWAAGNPGIYARVSGATDAFGYNNSANLLPLNTWAHVAVVFDGAGAGNAGRLKIYVNGNPVSLAFTGTIPAVAPTVAANATTGIILGSSPAIIWKGKMDEMRIWNVARSQTQIQSAMNLEINPTYSGLGAYYNFNEGVACCGNIGLTTLSDGMPAANDGALINFSLTSGCSSNWVAGAPALGDPLTLSNDWTNDCGSASGTYPVGATTVTWTATGANGETEVCVQTVTVDDTEAPAIILSGNPNVTVCQGDAYMDAGATASDLCDGNLTGSISTNNPVNTAVLGPYTVTYDVMDAAGNPALQVVRNVEVIECIEVYEITLTDPCTCLDNATTLVNGQFSETVEVNGPTGDTWTVVIAPGLYQTASPAPPAAPLPIAAGTPLPEGPAGVYTLNGRHIDAQGYSIQVTNGSVTLSISNTCYYPNPSLSGLNAVYCTQDGSQVATVTAQLGDGSGSASVENILFELIRQSDNTVVDSQPGVSNTFNFDPSALAQGQYTLRVTFDGDNDGAGHPGCEQAVEESFEVRAVGCGEFPWDGN